MNFEVYNEKRQELIDKASAMLESGEMGEDYKSLKAEIETLDNQYEESAKEFANLEALKDNPKAANLANYDVKKVETKVMETIGLGEEDDMHDSLEYRKAFMNHVIKNAPMPAKLTNADANTLTTDAPVVIPTTVMQKIIEKMESYGMIYSAVTKTAIKGGVRVPTSALKPVATWVAEGAKSDKQKKTVAYIEFTQFKLRCAVSMSLEMDTMALPLFEQALINNVAEAMIRAIEQAIISGNGSNGPKGILAETVVTGQAIELAKGAPITYDALVNAEAALPLAYEGAAEWLMTKKTFAEVLKIKDTAGQPICRVDHGIDGRPSRNIFGRPVILNDYMASYTTAPTSVTTCIALFNMADYVLNSNLDMTVKKYEDNETDDVVTKAIMLVDGKVVDKNSLVVVNLKTT